MEQVAQTVRKIAQIDDHICLAFAGLTADARVLVNKVGRWVQPWRHAGTPLSLLQGTIHDSQPGQQEGRPEERSGVTSACHVATCSGAPR